MTESLFGIPTNLTINDTPLGPEALQFSQWLANVFQPVGYNGTPDLATNPMETYQYLNNRRNVQADAANQPPLVRIADKNLNIMTTIGDINGGSYLSCEVEELIADSGKAKCVLLFSHWLTNWIINENSIYEDLHLLVDPIATQPGWRTRWGGKITEINIINNADGTGTVELHAVSMREHTKRLLFAANPIFPPEVQLPRMWVLPGPTRSVLMITMFINLARIFLPGLSFITNVFNPAAWLNPLSPDALLNINPMSWPLQVAFVNPIIDQSRWTVLGATWTDWHSAMNDILADSGVVCRAYTWLTTDVDSPHTELVDLITGLAGAGVDLLDLFGLGTIGELVSTVGTDIAALARPTRNCVVFSLEDDSGQTGPTGTALDGLLNVIGVTADDLITATLLNVDTGQTLNGEPIIDVAAPSPPIIQTLLGVAPAPPKVIWREGQFNGMLKSEVNMHKGPVLTVMTGGRSPTIVNESITFAIKYGLSQLSDMITLAVGASATFTPDNFTWQQPLTNGLDSLYQGQLDNCCARDTLVHGPDGDERIDVLAARGTPFRVWSVTPDGERVSAVATVAFKKGAAELFEYKLEDGRSIKTTREHRFLSDCGFIRGADVGVSTRLATVDHEELPSQMREVLPHMINDALYKAVPSSAAVKYLRVVSIRSIGIDDFFDMHVPGWENYSANGFWNHNTLLAWERFTDPVRAVWAGDLQYQEYFERGSSTAYTLAGWLTLSEANFKTRPFYGFTTEVRNGAPWIIGDDVLLGDRAGFELGGVIYVDQITAVKHTFDRKSTTVSMSIGDDRDKHDPVARAVRAMQSVYRGVSALFGEGTIFG
jgi:hypothetical protein